MYSWWWDHLHIISKLFVILDLTPLIKCQARWVNSHLTSLPRKLLITELIIIFHTISKWCIWSICNWFRTTVEVAHRCLKPQLPNKYVMIHYFHAPHLTLSLRFMEVGPQKPLKIQIWDIKFTIHHITQQSLKYTCYITNSTTARQAFQTDTELRSGHDIIAIIHTHYLPSSGMMTSYIGYPTSPAHTSAMCDTLFIAPACRFPENKYRICEGNLVRYIYVYHESRHLKND